MIFTKSVLMYLYDKGPSSLDEWRTTNFEETLVKYLVDNGYIDHRYISSSNIYEITDGGKVALLNFDINPIQIPDPRMVSYDNPYLLHYSVPSTGASIGCDVMHRWLHKDDPSTSRQSVRLLYNGLIDPIGNLTRTGVQLGENIYKSYIDDCHHMIKSVVNLSYHQYNPYRQYSTILCPIHYMHHFGDIHLRDPSIITTLEEFLYKVELRLEPAPANIDLFTSWSSAFMEVIYACKIPTELLHEYENRILLMKISLSL